jgi:predicted MFS family arabinose efflux permease
MKNLLSSSNMIIFSIAAGLMVANIYYAQPLIVQIAHDLNIGSGKSGLLVTMSQLGYAAGVFFIVPLGDRVDRRTILLYMLAVCTISLAGAAFSPTFGLLAMTNFIAGVTSSGTMVIIPYVASHADERIRGKAVGQVMTGLLLGILLARTISGAITELLTWRWIYIVAAIAVAILAILLKRIMIKDNPKTEKVGYGRLLFSILILLKTRSEVRWRCWFSFLGLAGFSVLWTGITYLFSAPPYNFSTATIGLFGLVGAAGALSANISGRLGDKGYTQILTVFLPFLLIICWLFMFYGWNALIYICVGIFIADIAVQGLQVTHQSVLYRLEDDIRSRVTAMFVTSGFLGMSLGSALASTSYSYLGWKGICVVGGSIAFVLFVSGIINTKVSNYNMNKLKI